MVGEIRYIYIYIYRERERERERERKKRIKNKFKPINYVYILLEVYFTYFDFSI